MKLSVRSVLGTSLCFVASIALLLHSDVVLARDSQSTQPPTETSQTEPSSNNGGSGQSSGGASGGINKPTGNTGAQKPEDSSGSGRSNTSTEHTTSTDEKSGRTETETEAESGKDKHGKLDATRLQVCEHRQGSMRQGAATINKTLQERFEIFTQVYTRVNEFQQKQGLNVSGYGDLSAKVIATQSAAAQAIDAAKTAPAVDCNSSDPTSQASANRATFVAARDSLKAYQAAIKQLVKAVKQAVTTNDSKGTAQ